MLGEIYIVGFAPFVIAVSDLLGHGGFDRAKVDAQPLRIAVFEPPDFAARYRVEIFDEDDLLVVFQDHQFVGIGQLALRFIRAVRPRPA